MTDPETSQHDYDEEAEMLALCRRFEERYKAYFRENPEADWVVFGADTEKLLSGGKDAEYLDAEGWAVLEQAAGQGLHVFGRPIDIGLDGLTPTFD